MKKLIKQLINKFSYHAPASVGSFLLNHFPATAPFLSSRHDYVYKSYLGKYSFLYNPKYGIEKEMVRGDYDPHSSSIIRKFVKEEFHCIDAGANVGAISILLADLVGPQGKVYAFEPSENTSTRLERNIAINNLQDTIKPIRKGLSNKEQKLKLKEPDYNLGNATTLDLVPGEGETISLTTIDKYFSGKPVKIDFIKIDVEGMELEVIEGGMRTIQKHRPIILYETLPIFNEYRKDKPFRKIEALLTKLGYTLYELKTNNRLSRLKPGEYPDNTLALPDNFR